MIQVHLYLPMSAFHMDDLEMFKLSINVGNVITFIRCMDQITEVKSSRSNLGKMIVMAMDANANLHMRDITVWP